MIWEIQHSITKNSSKAIDGLKSGKSMSGPDNVLLPLFKDFLEGALDGELSDHLTESEEANRRNDHTRKTIKTDQGRNVQKSHFKIETAFK